MNILIIGCGKVGSELAGLLDKRGHDVSVTDHDEERFENLPADFGGFTTPGVSIDQEVLKKAGIESCDAVCAVTEDDDLNIMAAQLAEELYHVPRVFARISDPDKAEVFKGFGIHTVCPTTLAVEAALAAIEDMSEEARVSIQRNMVSFVTMDMPREFVGKLPQDIQLEENESLFAIIRENGIFLLYTGQVITLGEKDRLVFARQP
ncbi:MAG: TrkA family potassium uptake protein [Oscillospiraceae bacterium]|nr:TrkA family potassium uptake protein [Oscillospiraceae bacterium]